MDDNQVLAEMALQKCVGTAFATIRQFLDSIESKIAVAPASHQLDFIKPLESIVYEAWVDACQFKAEDDESNKTNDPL